MPISLIWVVTFVQDQHFDNQRKIKLYRSIEQKGQDFSKSKLVELSNYLFLAAKFNLPQQQSEHPTLVKLSKSLNTFIWWSVVESILNFNFWNQQVDFGKLTVPIFYYFSIWNNFPKMMRTKNIKVLDKNNPNYYSFYKEGFRDDIKRVLFRKIRDWSDLINENNKKNISELRGLLTNKEVANEIESVFNSIDRLLGNDKVFQLFNNSKNKVRAQNINFDSIFEFWTLWSEVLKPFYAQTTTLKGKETEKLKFIQKHLTKTLTAEQKTTLQTMIQANATPEKVFEKMHYWNGLNLIEAVGEKLRTKTDLLKIDWIKLVLEFFNPTDIQKTLNVISTILIEYLFDRIEQNIETLKPKEYLNDVVLDLMDFFTNGLFVNQQKFQFLLDGAVEGFKKVREKLAATNSKWNVLSGTIAKLLNKDDLNRQTIWLIVHKLAQPEFQKLSTKISQWKSLLRLTKVVFGGFKIDKLKHIFEDTATKTALKTNLENLRKQFIKVADKAFIAKNNDYKNELIQMLVKTNELLKFLISDKILKPVGQEQLDSNFWLFFSVIMLYLERQDASWKKISEIGKILADNLSNDDVLQIATKILDLFDDFAQIVNTFVTWKANYPKAIIPSNEVLEKIFNLLGLYEKELNDKTFLGKTFNTLILIKKKYNNQIIAISKSGENYFIQKVNNFLKMIRASNWSYTINIVSSDDQQTIYDIVAESRKKIKNQRYKYSATIEIHKSEVNIVIKNIKELTIS